MNDANSGIWAVAAACCLCGGLGAGLLLLALRLARGRGGVLLLPLLQLFAGRHESAEDAVLNQPAPYAGTKPDLRAIARAQDFDDAVARQQAAQSQPGVPPSDWPMPPSRPFEAPHRPAGQSPRSRDEDEEFGSATLDE